MSKVAKVVAGAALVVAGVALAATGNPFGFQLIVSGLTLAGSALLQPKGQRREAQETSLSLGEVPRQAVFGRAGLGGSLVDAFNYGGKYGTDWEVLVIALADHRCEALEGFYVNDKYVAFAGDGAVAGYKGQLAVYWRPGTETQTLPAVVTANGPGWTANDNGAGVCFVVVAYKADKADAKEPVWPAGRPRFLWVLKGARCYSPRLDSSVGGAGAQRRADPSTWTWSENPIDCRYAWARGIYACDRVGDAGQLLVGRGLSEAEAPPANTFAPANLCDELVDGAKRYTIGGTIGAARPFNEIESLFASAIAGVVIQPEGSVEIEPGQAKAPVAAITDADRVVGSKAKVSDFRSEADDQWLNTVVPTYVEPAQKWAEHAAPVRRVEADIIADAGPREEPLSLPLVTREAQASRVAEIRRRLGRLQRTATVTLGPRFAELEEGDWITWTSARHFGGATVTFRIEAYSLDENWHMTLQLREIAASVYADGAMTGGSAAPFVPTAPPAAIGAPDPGSWALAAEQLTSGGAALPALVVTGAADDDYAEAVRFEYWRSDGVTPAAAVVDWVSAGDAERSVQRREITSVAPGAVYYVAIAFLVDGEPGDRLILGPVTAGEPLVAGQVTQLIGTSHVTDADPADGLLTATDATITIEAHARSYSDKQVDIAGGDLPTVAAAGQLNHVYYDDPTRAGGPVVFAATTDPRAAATSLANPGRHYVGSISTDAAGGTGTSSGGSSPPGWNPDRFYNEP